MGGMMADLQQMNVMANMQQMSMMANLQQMNALSGMQTMDTLQMPMQLPQSQRSGGCSPRTEKVLDRWVEAKRGRDFEVADRLRDELRERGIDAEKERPPL